MSSTIIFFFFIPFLSFILLFVNIIFAPRNPYMEKNSTFECGFSSFLGQNRTQFSISFFIFALLFLLFDLEILLVYPYLVSAYLNEVYGLLVLMAFLGALTIGFVFELGKKALTIDSRQTSSGSKKKLPSKESETHDDIINTPHVNETKYVNLTTPSLIHKTFLPKTSLSNNQKRLFSSTNCVKGLNMQDWIDKNDSEFNTWLKWHERHKMKDSYYDDWLHAKGLYDDLCERTGYPKMKKRSELNDDDHFHLDWYRSAKKTFASKIEETEWKLGETDQMIEPLRRNIMQDNKLPSIRTPGSITDRFLRKPHEWKPSPITNRREPMNPEQTLRSAYFEWINSEEANVMTKPHIPNTDIKGNHVDKPLEPVEISSHKFVDRQKVEGFLGKVLEPVPRPSDIKWPGSGSGSGSTSASGSASASAFASASNQVVDASSTTMNLLFLSLGELNPWIRFAFILRAMIKATSQVSPFLLHKHVSIIIPTFIVIRTTKFISTLTFVGKKVSAINNKFCLYSRFLMYLICFILLLHYYILEKIFNQF